MKDREIVKNIVLGNSCLEELEQLSRQVHIFFKKSEKALYILVPRKQAKEINKELGVRYTEKMPLGWVYYGGYFEGDEDIEKWKNSKYWKDNGKGN